MMTFRPAGLGALLVMASVAGAAAQTDTTTAQPVDPLLVLWPEGTPPPPPPVGQIRITWSTGIFR